MSKMRTTWESRLCDLIRLADKLRAAQIAYMVDRGKAVGAAAKAYDEFRITVAL